MCWRQSPRGTAQRIRWGILAPSRCRRRRGGPARCPPSGSLGQSWASSQGRSQGPQSRCQNSVGVPTAEVRVILVHFKKAPLKHGLRRPAKRWKDLRTGYISAVAPAAREHSFTGVRCSLQFSDQAISPARCPSETLWNQVMPCHCYMEEPDEALCRLPMQDASQG